MLGLEIVCITWIDSEVGNEWTELPLIEKDFHEIHSIGFLIEQNDLSYVLAGMLDGENQSANAIQYIPKGCVRKVTPLSLLKVLI